MLPHPRDYPLAARVKKLTSSHRRVQAQELPGLGEHDQAPQQAADLLVLSNKMLDFPFASFSILNPRHWLGLGHLHDDQLERHSARPNQPTAERGVRTTPRRRALNFDHDGWMESGGSNPPERYLRHHNKLLMT